MPKYEIKNPNGSRVFVKNTLVLPYSNFQAELDPSTVDELKKFGVSVRPVIHANLASSQLVLESPPASTTAEVPVLRSAIVSLPDNAAPPIVASDTVAPPDDSVSSLDASVDASDEGDPLDANVDSASTSSDSEASVAPRQWETREERRQRKKGRS